MNLSRKLFVSVVVTLSSFVVLNLNSGYATTVSRTFLVDNFSRPGPIGIPAGSPLSLGNSYGGVFIYDDATLTSSRFGSNYQSAQVLDLSFNFLGTTYTETDDRDYPQFPKVELHQNKDEDIVFLNFVINKPGFAGYFFTDQFTFGLSLGASAGRTENSTSVVDPNGLYFGRVTYGSATPVSIMEPLNLYGTVAASAMGLWLKRKQQRLSQAI